jgi:hypothetical protein
MPLTDCSNRRQLRNSVYKLLTSEIIEIEGAALKLGLLPDDVQSMWEKSCEVKTAERFLKELGIDADVMTLAEFTDSDRVPGGTQRLDCMCPDLVAVSGGQAIGLELTAYSDNPGHEHLSAAMRRISEICRAELAAKFPELAGCTLFYDLIESDVIRKAKFRHFGEQLLHFAREQHLRRSFGGDECRRFPERGMGRIVSPFGNYPLLTEHVSEVTIYHRAFSTLPVSVPPGGFASSFGTSIDCLVNAIDGKRKALRNAYLEHIQPTWLLIHATGSLVSSRITPMTRGEIADLLGSEALPMPSYQDLTGYTFGTGFTADLSN